MVTAPLDAAPLVPDNGVIVKFEDTARTLSSVSRFYSGTQSIQRLKSRGGEVLIRAENAGELSDLIDRLRDDSSVEYFGLNVVKQLSYLPDDPLFFNAQPRDQFLFKNQYYHRLIRAPQAWNKTTGRDDVVVAVIDSGIDVDHPDLKHNLWTNSAEAKGVDDKDDDNNGFVDDIHGWDTTCIDLGNGARHSNSDCNAASPNDKDIRASEGHGTAVAGLISAETGNRVGMAGLAGGGNGDPGVTLMAVRAGTREISLADEIEAIDLAAQHGADVINLSFGGPSGGEPERNAIRRARADGALVVAAAGNIHCKTQVVDVSPSYDYPAKFDEVIGVGMTTLANPGGEDPRETFSCESKWDPHSDAQSLVAPGVQIISLAPDGNFRFPGAEGNFVTPESGTSFASPLVAGTAALVLSVNPELSASQVRDILESTADDFGKPGYDRKHGHGRVNAQRAVTEALERSGAQLPAADLNGDGFVDEDDLQVIKAFFGATRGDNSYNRSVDLNDDGVIDELDALIIAEQLGEGRD